MKKKELFFRKNPEICQKNVQKIRFGITCSYRTEPNNTEPKLRYSVNSVRFGRPLEQTKAILAHSIGVSWNYLYYTYPMKEKYFFFNTDSKTLRFNTSNVTVWFIFNSDTLFLDNLKICLNVWLDSNHQNNYTPNTKYMF